MPKEKFQFETITSSSTHSNGKVKEELFYQAVTSNNLEANAVFPEDPKSSYISSYFPDSFDFPYNPDPLASANNYKIYDEMKHDDQVKAAMSFKKDQIVSSGWQIKCDVPEIVERLESNLKESLSSSFEDSLRDVLSAFEYGFSLTEPVYKKASDGLIELKDLKTRPPHTFEFHLNSYGDVEKVTQNADIGSIDFEPNYFLHYIYQPEFGNPFGKSDLRAAHQAWKAKKFFFRFWAIYVERFAAPTIIGEYPNEFDPSKVARLQSVLNTIQNSTVAIVPEGTKIDFKLVNRDSSNIYENGITLLNTMIARAILMPDLLGVSGSQTKGGSYALGDTQFQLFMGIIKREQEALARKITLKILKPLVKANWGDYPVEFQFKPHSKDDAMEALKIWVEATKVGKWKPDEDEIKHFLESIKFPVSEKIEIVDEPTAQPGFGPFGKPSMAPKNGNNLNTKEQAEEEELFDKLETRIYRELTSYEKQLNFKEIERNLDLTEERALRKIKSAAKDIYIDFIDQIKDKRLLTRFKPEAINELSLRFQKPMNIEFRTFMKETFQSSFNQAQKEIFPKMAKKFQMEEERLPEEFLDIIEAESFKLVGDYSVNISNKMRNKLVQGIKNGVNERDLLKELRELGEEETDKWLKTVIRTKTTEMFNRGRKSFFDNDEFAKQIIEAYQFSAVMDDRTSEICRSLDGKVYEKGEFINHIVPPLHFNCRSLLVPITKFEDYEVDKSPSLDSLKDKGGNLIV